MPAIRQLLSKFTRKNPSKTSTIPHLDHDLRISENEDKQEITVLKTVCKVCKTPIYYRSDEEVPIYCYIHRELNPQFEPKSGSGVENPRGNTPADSEKGANVRKQAENTISVENNRINTLEDKLKGLESRIKQLGDAFLIHADLLNDLINRTKDLELKTAQINGNTKRRISKLEGKKARGKK